MRHLMISILTVLICQSSFAAQPIRAEYLEETELVGVVSHLAGIPGYDWDEDEALSDYLAEVDSFFAPYKNHKVVKFAARRLLNKGFNWHFPMHVALAFKIEEGRIKAKKDLERDFDGYYERISRGKEKRLLRLLGDFYRKSDFHGFYESHRPLYEECERAMQDVLDKIDFDWYDSFFGPRENNSFKIHLSIITGPANYAARQRCKDGSEKVCAVMGCCARNEEGRIFYGIHYTLPTIIHECNHSYCNPLNDEVWDQIKDKATEMFSPNAEFYRSIAYGNPLFVMNETFVEACVIRYLMSHDVDLKGYTIEDWIQMDEVDKKFVMIRDIINVLDEREADYDKYPTMSDFMPRYVEAINDFQLKREEN